MPDGAKNEVVTEFRVCAMGSPPFGAGASMPQRWNAARLRAFKQIAGGEHQIGD
jgi:hypothetical protein